MKLLLLGDVCPTVCTESYFDRCDVDALFGDVKTLFSSADYSIVNLECAITDSNNAIKKFGPNLKAPLNTAKALKELGVDCCSISNNHIFDFGIEGVKQTVDELDKVGIVHTGFGENYEDSRKNLTVKNGNETVSVISVCEKEFSYALDNRMGSRPFDEYDTMEDIREAKKASDRVIVLYHGGKELCKYPSPRVYKLCRAMAKNGADVVLCQHSHCIVTYENYNNCHILHGQGNFHFVKKDHPFDGWYNSLAFVYDTVSGKADMIPVICNKTGIEIAKGKDKDKILSEFNERNKELANGDWKTGWHKFCVEHYDGYVTKVIGNAGLLTSSEEDNAAFAHYLDCQAHTDVWRELFPTYNETNEI